MEAELMDRAREGLEAWVRGDVSALEPLLDPEVELLWWEAGGWDCHGRGEVLSLLRERAEVSPAGGVELVQAGPQALVVSRMTTVPDGPEAGFTPATVVTFRGGKVVSMRQYRSQDEALAAAR
jgi:ketosteroid isomerase-like protein